jgi:hypothetical protein
MVPSAGSSRVDMARARRGGNELQGNKNEEVDGCSAHDR